jgi:hypothetical protein
MSSANIVTREPPCQLQTFGVGGNPPVLKETLGSPRKLTPRERAIIDAVCGLFLDNRERGPHVTLH